MKNANNDELQSELNKYMETLERAPRTFKRGDIVTGNIVSIGKGEMIVDVAGRAEGVVLGKEMKLEGEKLDKKPGDEILVYVINEENALGQIELSIRRTGTARKWHELNKALEGDLSVKVTVLEANTGGVIVNIGGGLRGFVPTSQLNNSRIYPLGGYSSKEDADKELQTKLAQLIGTELEVKVIEIDREKNRVIFSEKDVISSADKEKRAETLDKVKAGDTLEGEVTGIAPFGLFVNAQGLEGLVHLSEISWDKVVNPADFHKVGEKVKVQVIGIDDHGKRIAYSIKRLLKDPWDEIVRKYQVGQRVKGEVTKTVDYGAFVRIDEGLNGLIHISELSDKLVKDPAKVVEIGKTYELEIISISKEERHLGLSLKRVLSGESTPVKKKAIKTTAETGNENEGVSLEMTSLSEYLDDGEEKSKETEAEESVEEPKEPVKKVKKASKTKKAAKE